MSGSTLVEAASVIDFWFGLATDPAYGQERKAWFAKDDAFDAEVRTRFGATIEQGLRGELDGWSEAQRSALAQILVLDQLTRNAFRGTPRAFAGDARALAAASRMVGERSDESLPTFMRAFVYMPFEHAEGLAMQDEAVRLFTRLVSQDPAEASKLDYAHRHRAVIERFMCELTVDLPDMASRFAASPAALLADAAPLSAFAADGLVSWDGARLAVTRRGRPFLRNVAALFDQYLQQTASGPRHARAV